MDEGNLPILVDAKTEYTKQLINIISPVIYQGIKLIYNESKNKSIDNEETNQCLSYFQTELSEIPKWNQITITEKYNNVIEYSKCDWLEDLLTAVFVSHTKILTSINTNKNKNKINLQIPKVDFFIHQCYIEVAREFWKNPYLFDDNVNNFEYQRNRRDASQIIENIISETIRKQLPVKNILKEYLGSEYSEEKNDSIESNNITDNLRKLVKNEIENCSKEKLSALNIEQHVESNEDNTLTNQDLDAFKNTKVENLEDSIELSKEENIGELTDENGKPIKINKVKNNDLVLGNIDDLINNEVDKLELISENDFELNAKNLDENLSKELNDLSQLEEVYIDDKKSKSAAESNSDPLKLDESKSISEGEAKPLNLNLEESNSISEAEAKPLNLEESKSSSNAEAKPLNLEESKSSSKAEAKPEDDLIELNKSVLDLNSQNNENNENLKLEIKNDLELEELNLDSLDDLNFDINNLESDTEEPEVTKKENNVKTIIIDTKQSNDQRFDNDRNLEINEQSSKKKVLNKYSSKRKKDFSFFSDALS